MVSNLVLLDGRISPEAKLLHMHVESMLRYHGNVAGRIRMGELARRQGCTVRTVHRTLSKITSGRAECEVPLVELFGDEKIVRTIKLLGLHEVYGGPLRPEIERARVTFPRGSSFEDLHGKAVAACGFTPVPNALLTDVRIKPAARVLVAILIHRLSQSSGTSAQSSLAELGRALGISSRDNVRAVLAAIDTYEGRPDQSGRTRVLVPIVNSQPMSSLGRLFTLIGTDRPYPSAMPASPEVIPVQSLVEVGRQHVGSPLENVRPLTGTILSDDRSQSLSLQTGSDENEWGTDIKLSDKVRQKPGGIPT